jgi:uncharacterized protein
VSFIAITVSSLLLLDLAWLLIGDRLLRRARWPGDVRIAHASIIAAQLAGLVGIMYVRNADVRIDPPKALWSTLYIWHLLIAPLLLPGLVLALLVGLIRWLFRAMRRTPAAEPGAQQMSRRVFLQTAAVVAPQLVTFSLTGIALRQIERFRVRRFTIRVADLPASLDGATIAHVSDTHVGRFTTGPVLRRLAEATNELRADVILLTGDLINGALNEIPEAIEFVRRLDAAAGVYVVEGNHDLFQGRAAFENDIKAAGIRLLVNETERIRIRQHPVELLGLRWGLPGAGGRRPRSTDDAIAASFAELLARRDPDSFPILLAHHPHAFDAAAAAQLPLTLAGHTHGGQLMLNQETGFGPVMFRYWTGLYTRANSQLVVSNGAGNWFPLRTAAPAEIVHITLRRA